MIICNVGYLIGAGFRISSWFTLVPLLVQMPSHSIPQGSFSSFFFPRGFQLSSFSSLLISILFCFRFPILFSLLFNRSERFYFSQALGCFLIFYLFLLLSCVFLSLFFSADFKGISCTVDTFRVSLSSSSAPLTCHQLTT